MTSHGWLLVSLLFALVLSGVTLVVDRGGGEPLLWLTPTIVVLALLRLTALIMVWRRFWNGVLLGLAPSGLGLLLHLADNLGLLPSSPAANQTIVGLNWGIVLSGAIYLAAAYAARARRAGT